MWEVVRRLRAEGVTIILTTHYIEEAEEIADRVGVISKGELILVDEKESLMKKLGEKELAIELQEPLSELPASLATDGLTLSEDGCRLVYRYDTRSGRTGIGALIADLYRADIRVRDLQTKQSSLEDIFVRLVREGQ